MTAKSLPIDEMYRVLRGLPGRMQLVSPAGEKYILTVVNPNAPANRCQETPGLSISLEGPDGSPRKKQSSKKLTVPQLEVLRSGAPLTLAFDDIEINLQSNPGGELVRLDENTDEDFDYRDRTDCDVYREIGKSGIRVFGVGLGAMPLSMSNSPKEEQALAVVHAAIGAGINFIDTANVYCAGADDIGRNERLIEKALTLSGMKKSIIVATKGGVDKTKGAVDASPSFLRSSLISSLEALKCETIALYQLHAPDDKVPFDESVGELSRLQEEGKIAHIGLCNVTSEELEQALKIVRIESVQNACNPFRANDYAGSLVKVCKEHSVSYIPHSVIGGKSHCKALIQHPVLIELAKKYDASAYAVVIAWHLTKGDRVIPIPGASQVSSVISSTSAARLVLSTEDILRLDSISSLV